MGAIDDIRDELAIRAASPLDDARAMPPAFYKSAAFHALEREEIFRKDWVCLGHVGEVAAPGDYFTLEVVGEPLLVVRGEDSQVRVLSNVCRHRANLVARGAGNRRRFVCGYHAWAYATDGALANAPFMAGNKGFDPRTCALPAFRSEIWQDFIFVDLSGEAEPLTSRLDWFLPRMANYGPVGRHHQFVAEETWTTNWKCLFENFMEGYHLSSAHPQTLHPMTPTALCRKIPCGAGATAYLSGYDPGLPDRGPFPESLTEEERRNSLMFGVFPNLLVGLVSNVTLYMTLYPLDADRVGIKWGLAGTVADRNDAGVVRYRDLCMAFNAEDKVILEAVQKGLNSRFYDGGPLAPADFEGTIVEFHRYVASRVGGVPFREGAT